MLWSDLYTARVTLTDMPYALVIQMSLC